MSGEGYAVRGHIKEGPKHVFAKDNDTLKEVLLGGFLQTTQEFKHQIKSMSVIKSWAIQLKHALKWLLEKVKLMLKLN